MCINRQLSIIGICTGVAAIAYTGYVHYKSNKTGHLIADSIDNVSKDIDVVISDIVIEEAVKVAVEREVNKAVKEISYQINNNVSRDIKKEVKSVVDAAYADIRKSVSKEVSVDVANLDIDKLKADVKEEAKEIVLSKFNGNLDSMLQDFNQNLTNVSRIYTSIAETMTKKPSETVFKIGG